jgi:hypothetical protein
MKNTDERLEVVRRGIAHADDIPETIAVLDPAGKHFAESAGMAIGRQLARIYLALESKEDAEEFMLMVGTGFAIKANEVHPPTVARVLSHQGMRQLASGAFLAHWPSVRNRGND